MSAVAAARWPRPFDRLEALLRNENVRRRLLLVASACGYVAIRLRSDRWLFTATVIAVPILALYRLAPLLVLPRLGRSK